MTRQKCYVLTVSALLIGIIFLVNFYFLRVISSESQNVRKVSTQKYYSILSEKTIPSYINGNSHFYPVFNGLKRRLSLTSDANLLSLWDIAKKWPTEEGIYVTNDVNFANILNALRTAKIVQAENSQKGTQLKLSLTLEGNQKVFFKPKWYKRDHIIKGSVYSGKDRHNAEVVAFYVSLLLDIRWVPLAVMRRVNMKSEIWDTATPQLKQTMFQQENGTVCLYGKCFYCRRNETVCSNSNGEVEGAVILLVNQTLKKFRSPWQRTYNTQKRAEWEYHTDYCSVVKKTLPLMRILDLIDAAIFDFLLQNGDRHHYETFLERVILLDNGKGLGNPHKDYIDILAPLYQCCLLRKSTWDRLRLVSGGALSSALSSFSSQEPGAPILSDLHLQAIERRLITVYEVVKTCKDKHGSSIFKNK